MPQRLSSPRVLRIQQIVETPRDSFAFRGRVPMIRLRGEWLEENGFVPGARVLITVDRGRIVVTLAGEVR